MRQVRDIIEIREGEKVEVLYTPSLFGIARQRNLVMKAEGDQPSDVLRVYCKALYCAAINAWECRRYDHPDIGEFPYSYIDFEEWSYREQKDFARKTDALFLALTGKTLKEAAKEASGEKKRLTDNFTLDLDYAEMEAFLVGRCGKTDLQARLTSMEEFQYLAKGKEEDNRIHWVTARWMAYRDILLSPNVPQYSKPTRVQDVVVFPWEAEEEEKRINEAAAQARVTPDLNAALNKIFNNGKDR